MVSLFSLFTQEIISAYYLIENSNQIIHLDHAYALSIGEKQKRAQKNLMQLQVCPQHFSIWDRMEKLKPVSESGYTGLWKGTKKRYKVSIILKNYDFKTFSHFRSRTLYY